MRTDPRCADRFVIYLSIQKLLFEPAVSRLQRRAGRLVLLCAGPHLRHSTAGTRPLGMVLRHAAALASITVT